MSESVNFKVVIAFIIFIFVFACIGLFGLFNKDLIQNKEETTTTKYVPVVNAENSYSCSGTGERSSIKYDFILNSDNSIKNVRVIYSAVEGTQEDYNKANDLKNLKIIGINSTIENDYNNFILTMYINMNNVDMSALLSNKELFDNLGITVGNYLSYDEYHSLLTNYTCEKTSK